jgi:hypothetical protein
MLCRVVYFIHTGASPSDESYSWLQEMHRGKGTGGVRDGARERSLKSGRDRGVSTAGGWGNERWRQRRWKGRGEERGTRKGRGGKGKG